MTDARFTKEFHIDSSMVESGEGLAEMQEERSAEKPTAAPGKLSLRALASILEDTANASLQPIGLGTVGMHEKGYAWIIVRRELDIKRLPHEGETIQSTTYAGSGRHGLYPRWYELRAVGKPETGAETTPAASSDPIITASCQWCIIDRRKRDMLFSDEPVKDAPIVPKKEYGPRVTPVVRFPELTHEETLTVTEDFIDSNGHMNNSFYLKWAEDIARLAGFENEEPKRLWIEYAKELMLGEEVKLSWERIEKALYVKGSSNDMNNDPVINFSLLLSYDDVDASK